LGSLDGNGTQFYLTDAQGGASMKSNQLFGPYGTGGYYTVARVVTTGL